MTQSVLDCPLIEEKVGLLTCIVVLLMVCAGSKGARALPEVSR